MGVVQAAVIGTTLLGIVGTKMSADAASDANDATLALNEKLAEQQRNDLEPWRNAGAQALVQIQEGIANGDFNPKKFDPTEYKTEAFKQAVFKPPTAENLQDDPGYQFRLEQGIKARERSASSRGSLQSGAQQKAIERFAQGTASQEYGNAYARAQNNYSREHGQNSQTYARNLAESNNLYSREAGEYNTEANRLNNNFNRLNTVSSSGQNAAAGQANASGNLAINQTNAYATEAQSTARRNADFTTGINQGIENWLTYKGTKPELGSIKPLEFRDSK